LREVGDRLYVAKLLCTKGCASLAGNGRAAAESALSEAEMIMSELSAKPASDLGRRIEALRAALVRAP